jgi:hypothetical protein
MEVLAIHTVHASSLAFRYMVHTCQGKRMKINVMVPLSWRVSTGQRMVDVGGLERVIGEDALPEVDDGREVRRS